jgi:hypothetical protein
MTTAVEVMGLEPTTSTTALRRNGYLIPESAEQYFGRQVSTEEIAVVCKMAREQYARDSLFVPPSFCEPSPPPLS